MGICLASKFTRPLYQEILALRLPVERWLQMHHLDVYKRQTCMGVAKQVKQLVDDGVQVAIVTGGGNFWRGRTSETIDRVKADQIGMLATCLLYTSITGQ